MRAARAGGQNPGIGVLSERRRQRAGCGGGQESRDPEPEGPPPLQPRCRADSPGRQMPNPALGGRNLSGQTSQEFSVFGADTSSMAARNRPGRS